MTQYNSLNVTLSNSQLNKFKSAIKDENEVVLRLSLNMINLRKSSNLHKAFANHLLADIKLSKAQLSKMIQSGCFLGTLRGPKNRITFNKKYN